MVSDKVQKPSEKAKHWYESKTMIFNLLFIAISILVDVTPALEGHLPEAWYGVMATGVAFVNAVLRLATSKPIKGRADG